MRVRIVTVGLAVLALLLAACGGDEAPQASPEAGDTATGGGSTASPAEAGTEAGEAATAEDDGDDVFAEVLAEVEGLTGEERRTRLAELAAEVGDVSLYTSISESISAELLGAFEDATGLGVAVYRADNATVAERIAQEADAGFRGADVTETDGVTLALLNQQGHLRPYEPPNAAELIEGSLQNGWTATRLNIFTVAWNTDNVAEGEQPTSYQDLADPRWDGRMAMDAGDYDWYYAVYNYLVEDQGMSEEDVDQLFADMAEGADFVTGHTAVRQLLAAGEYALMVSDYSYGTQAAIEEGAPLAWQPPVEPLFARPNGVALIANAPNPAAGLLFHEWITSDGQEVLQSLAVDPVRADLASTGDADLRTLDIDAFIEEEQMWQQDYEALAGAGGGAAG